MNVTIEPAVDDSFPSTQGLRAARALADSHGLRARAEIAALIDREYSGILGAGDRRELLENIFAARAARVSGLFTGLGLACSSTDSAIYGPSSWTLAAHRDRERYVFIVSGIRTTSGGATSVRMSAEVFNSACRAWRAIAKAAGVAKRDKPRAAEWRQIWWGIYSKRRTVVGVRTALYRDCMSRRNGGDHDSK